jgi:hypothetical protein
MSPARQRASIDLRPAPDRDIFDPRRRHDNGGDSCLEAVLGDAGRHGDQGRA